MGSLPAANLPDLGRQNLILFFEILESLLASGLCLLLVAVGEVRLEHGPPAVVELRPFLPAKQGAHVGNVTVSDEGVLQTLGVATHNAGEEVVHALEDYGMVAGKVLESQIGPFAAHGVEKHGEATCQYFGRLLQQPDGYGAEREDRLVYGEGLCDVDAALDLLARHIVDQRASNLLFDDRRRLQEDLLADAANTEVRKLFSKVRGCPSGAHRRAK